MCSSNLPDIVLSLLLTLDMSCTSALEDCGITIDAATCTGNLLGHSSPFPHC